MLIEFISHNAEQKLLSAFEQSDQHHILRGVLYFRCSNLGRKAKEKEILSLLKPLLEDKEAAIYIFRGGDLAFTWNGAQKAVAEDICKKIYSYFDLTGNEGLHTYFDSKAHAENIRLLCYQKIQSLSDSPKKAPILTFELPASEPSVTLAAPTSEQITAFRIIAKKRSQRKSPEILVVEDQPFSIKLLTGVLERVGKVYPALTAQAGLDLYLTHAPDIVFMDVEMPGINGHDLTVEIRRLDADAYIIMVTANNYIEDVNRAKHNGAKGFIAKPYSKQKILEGVDKYNSERKIRP